MQVNYKKQYKKIALAGDRQVGKTSFLDRFIFGKFDKRATMSDDPYKEIKVQDGFCLLSVRDPRGQERFGPLCPAFYSRVNGIIIVYDISNRESFKSVLTHLYAIQQTLDMISPERRIISIEYMLIGTKTDLNTRQVSPDEGQQLANDNNMIFMEVSSLSGFNVELAFQSFAQEMLNNKLNDQLQQSQNIKLIAPVQKNHYRCL